MKSWNSATSRTLKTVPAVFRTAHRRAHYDGTRTRRMQTISNGQFTVTVDSSTTQTAYVTGQSHVKPGDPYDALLFLDTYGCQLN
jgi:hypothetical protein